MLFSHPEFANPGMSLTTPILGQITAAGDSPRVVQFALRYVFDSHAGPMRARVRWDRSKEP